MGQAIEQYLHPAVAFGVLPLFAFFNAGVTIDAATMHQLVRPVGGGILLGPVIGKQVGIMAMQSARGRNRASRAARQCHLDTDLRHRVFGRDWLHDVAIRDRSRA